MPGPLAEIIEAPFDPHSEADRALLLRQRRQCGWACSEEIIDTWRKELAQKDPGWALYWIRRTPEEEPVGHIGFAWRHSDPELASPELSRCLGFRLWVRPDLRGSGVARAAWASNHRRALATGCKWMTGTTFADSWAMDKEFYRARGAQWGIHHTMPMEAYYVGLGSKVFKRAKTFEYTWPNGVTEKLERVYFIHELRPDAKL